MANSSFEQNSHTPIPVGEGGTGLASLTDKGVLIGAGANDVTFVALGSSGNILKSDGTNWTSGTFSVADGSVSYSKIANDLKQIVDLGTSNNIDWSQGAIYTKILTSNTIITFSNYQLNKSIVFKVSGNYPLIFPNTLKNISGLYNPSSINYIFLHCTKSTSPQEVWATINQKFPGYGYFAGGDSGANVVVADRIVFSTGVTSANTASNLSQARFGLTGVSDISSYGYFAGGNSGGYLATADRITFSTGTTAANTASNLSTARYLLTALSDASNYGYFTGGNSGLDSTERIVFSTGATSANTISNLSMGRYSLASSSDSTTYGYFSGGAGTFSNLTDRITFSTGATAANTVSNLTQSKGSLCGLSDSTTYGYFSGGSTGAYVNTTDRIIFSTGVTAANTVSNLSTVRYDMASASSINGYGYFSGGGSPTYVATTDRITFSTGATSANTVSNLSVARRTLAGLSDCAV